MYLSAKVHIHVNAPPPTCVSDSVAGRRSRNHAQQPLLDMLKALRRHKGNVYLLFFDIETLLEIDNLLKPARSVCASLSKNILISLLPASKLKQDKKKFLGQP
jgi:hypothetical protein